MRVFIPEYTDKHTGQKRRSKFFHVSFKDHTGVFRRLRGHPVSLGKARTAALGLKLEALVSCRANHDLLSIELQEWIETMPPPLREQLAGWDIIDARRLTGAKPLTDHLADWAGALKAKGNSEAHVDLVVGRAKRVIEGCEFKFWSDLSASQVMVYLNDLRQDHLKKDTDFGQTVLTKRGISAQTFNFYLQAVKQFSRWMVRDRRARENPLAHLDGLNVRTDRRRNRRALTVDESVTLLDKAEYGPERFSMTGGERAMLYRLALETGLRSSELRSLTRECFDLDASPATVTVRAAYSKHRRDDTLPLRQDTVAKLKGFLKTKAPAAQAFTMPEKRWVATMFRGDLEAAGIDFRDDAGRVADFHSLRHTFITNLASAGVHPKVAQSLARHSTITLTMDRYSHSHREQEIDALAKLPDLAIPVAGRVKATGTDPGTVSNACAPLARKDEKTRSDVAKLGQSQVQSGRSTSSRKQADLQANISGGGGIRTHDRDEPDAGFQDRSIQPLWHPTGPVILAVNHRADPLFFLGFSGSGRTGLSIPAPPTGPTKAPGARPPSYRMTLCRWGVSVSNR